MHKLAYLGPQGTYSEEAALRHARQSDLMPCASESAVAAAVESSEAEEGVLAIENSLEGSVARSLDALIHETNLKKQGMLALTLSNPDDYERFQSDDTVDIVGIAGLAPGRPVRVVLHHANGKTDEITTTHTMSPEHIEWFRAGSALNVLRAQEAERA